MLGYGQIERLLQDLHAIPDGRRTALASRLRYFHRISFPAGMLVGRGLRTRYEVPQILEMALAFELLQFEMSPTRAAKIVTTGWSAARRGFFQNWNDRNSPGDADDRLLLATKQSALDLLASEREADLGPDETLIAITRRDLEDWSAGLNPGERRLLFIDPRRLLEAVRNCLDDGLLRVFDRDMERWVSEG